MQLSHIHHSGQIFTYSDSALHLPGTITNSLLSILRRWETTYPHEDTLIQSRCRIPSLFVRFDCVVDPTLGLQVYEIQDGCGGIGYAGITNDLFHDARDSLIRDEWPNLKELRSQNNKMHDDDLWLERVNLNHAFTHDGPLIVRSSLLGASDQTRTIIKQKSVTPVSTRNNKEYGVTFGWWKRVGWESTTQGESLPWHEGFALKPDGEACSRDVMVWNPHKRIERDTRSQILRALKERKSMLLQPLIPPMLIEQFGKAYNMIYRPYFAYSHAQRAWIPLHGMWIARPYPNTRIHGASDAIWGPLYCE